MRTVRLIREIPAPGQNGPTNGMFALQGFLRDVVPWLEIGGELQPADVPWVWCWADLDSACEFARQNRPFVLGPCVFFSDNRQPCSIPQEVKLCNAPSCQLIYTESEWYRRLILENLGPDNRAPIVLWSFPLEPCPSGPIAAEPKYDLLIYAKRGYRDRVLNDLQEDYPKSLVMQYGTHGRAQLWQAAQKSRCCAYLSDLDRGPLGLAEIMLTGCQAVGMPKGAPWIEPGLSGEFVQTLRACDLMRGIDTVLSRGDMRIRTAQWARERFDTQKTLEIILVSLAEMLAKLSRPPAAGLVLEVNPPDVNYRPVSTSIEDEQAKHPNPPNETTTPEVDPTAPLSPKIPLSPCLATTYDVMVEWSPENQEHYHGASEIGAVESVGAESKPIQRRGRRRSAGRAVRSRKGDKGRKQAVGS